jgi:hypothetical protein
MQPWVASEMAADEIARYTFLSWVRRGIATALQLKPGHARATVSVEVTINTTTAPSVDLQLLGAGDITGLDGRSVIRTWPLQSQRNAEPNYFPLLEFDQPDLPWRYSPDPDRGDNRLRPWIAIHVVKSSDVNLAPAGPGRPLGILTVPVATLPDLSQSWAWAHTHFSGTDTITASILENALATKRGSFLSRVLSPRRMDANTEYTAFLVPTFERGRRVGLDLPLDGVTADQLAWTRGAPGSVSLPVYYQWSFHTAPEGDFASLAKKIHPHPLPPSVGFRSMDVSKPGFNLPPAANAPMHLQGALRSTTDPPPGGALDATFVQKLVDLLNLPFKLLKANAKDLVVAPPLYGRWHAAQADGLVPPSPNWFHQLNEDPTSRVAAGAGTLAVQSEQQQLLAGAWQQVDGIRQANEKLRLAQHAREMALKMYARAFSVTTEKVMMLTAPVHALVLGSPVTIRQLFRDSPISDGVLEPQFRRLARPTGPIGRRQGRIDSPRPSNILDRMNRGEFSPAPPPPTPDTMLTPSRSPSQIPGWATPGIRELLHRLPDVLLLLAMLLLVLALLWLLTGVRNLLRATGVAAIGAAAVTVSRAVRRFNERLDVLVGLHDATLTGSQIRAIPPRATFVPVDVATGSRTPRPVPTTAGAPGADNGAAANFRAAAAVLFDRLAIPLEQQPPLQAVNLTALRSKLATALNPHQTIAASVRSRLRLDPGLYQLGDDPLASIMAAPEFDEPMYKPLKKLSQDWILPGIDQVVPDSAALVQTNQNFIEAYMVGLNHEMSRSLLFNEFPTDLRGSYFRQFWDSTGYFPPAGETPNKDDFRDIRQIHTWRRLAGLGDNSSRRPPRDHVVLLVRGELLLRYPNTEVYAAEVVLKGGKRDLPDHTDTKRHKAHVFHGELDPDMRFYGFELTPNEARAGGDAKLGYYFVLQQHPGEPQFGLQADALVDGAPTTFKQLAWTQVVPDRAQLDTLSYLSLAQSSPAVDSLIGSMGGSASAWSVSQGTPAANFAFNTLRQPARVAFHATVLMPA